MIEELFIKIIQNDDEIVIFNSDEFEIKKGRKKTIKEKNFKNFEKKFEKNSFTIFDIKKDSFNILFLYPFDKILKKFYWKFNKKKVISKFWWFKFCSFNRFWSKKNIKFINNFNKSLNIKRFINNEFIWNKFYTFLQTFKIFLKKTDLFKKFKQNNFIITYSIKKLKNINRKAFCFLYKKFKNEYWNDFEITKYNENYFFDKNIYKKIKNILES